jgi:hypothetical protein
VFPCWWKVLPAEESVKQFRDKGYGSLGEIPQRPVRDAIRARSLTKLEPVDGLFDLKEGLVNFGSLAGAYLYARITSSAASVTAGDDGSFTD